MDESPTASYSSPSASDAGDLPDPRSMADSARGWQRVQLAVLGFIGFCGVMWAGGDPAGPGWLQWSSGALVVLALVLACAAVYLVGRVAYPFHHRPVGPAAGSVGPPEGARRLRSGITLTYLAVVVLVVATLSGWWPAPSGADEVEVRDGTGAAWCGQLRDAPEGAVRVHTTDGTVTLALRDLVIVRPVDTC